MAKVFSECLKGLISAKEEFAPTQYPLLAFENVAPKVQEALLKKAENKFNYSHRTIVDFYGYLFDTLHEAKLSDCDGVQASAMYVIYYNAMQTFPKFAELPFNERCSLMKVVCRKAKRDERNLKGYAMKFYFALVAKELDNVLDIQQDGRPMKGFISKCVGNEENPKYYKRYKKVYQNFKSLRDFDTGRVYVRNFPVWTSYQPVDDSYVVPKVMVSSDIWELLTKVE